MSHLTKSDFKASIDCPTRLHYRKEKYPSANDDDEYLQFLADGGFLIEFIAKAQHPGAHDLSSCKDAAKAFADTTALLAAGESVTIFEAAANHGRFHARTDILVRQGKVLRLIEVKSSSVDPNDEADDAKSPLLTATGVVSRWLPYVQDVAFQTMVLRQAFPGFTVEPFLAVVDKSFIATEAETLGQFRLTKLPPGPGQKHPRPVVEYIGNNPAALATSKIIHLLDAGEAVRRVWADVVAQADRLAALLTEKGANWDPPDLGKLYRECRDCEFRTEPTEKDPRSGFRRCWGELAASPSHILDLHRVGQIESKEHPDPVPELLGRKSASYLDLAKEQLGKPDSAWTARRVLEWSGTAQNKEHLPDALRDALNTHLGSPGYPLHFVDFEACNVSLPYHAGLRPYERVAFQWSCHTVHADGTVTHRDWLNEDLQFPNFTFARKLRETIGDTGTVYVWSPYEQGTLKRIMEQLHAAQERHLPDADPGLAQWIDTLLGPEIKKKRTSPRIRDLHDLAYQHYFHPRMKGRTSIKVVLPAVWESDARLRDHPCFSTYHRHDKDGNLLDPYQTLAGFPLGEGVEEVREGTGAIRVYQDLLFEPASPFKQDRLKLLKQYCQLDTAAMLMIWVHWSGRYDLRSAP